MTQCDTRARTCTVAPRGAVIRGRSINEGRGRWQVTQVHRCVQSRACPNHSISVAFLFQSPDKKKVLTTQRTFDSEGELKHPSCFVAPFGFMSQTSLFLYFCMRALQRRSCTRTTRRRPYTTTRTRTPSPDNPNRTKTSWCSTGPFAPPGASSAWSGPTLTPSSHFSPHRLLTVYILCRWSLGMLAL